MPRGQGSGGALEFAIALIIAGVAFFIGGLCGEQWGARPNEWYVLYVIGAGFIAIPGVVAFVIIFWPGRSCLNPARRRISVALPAFKVRSVAYGLEARILRRIPEQRSSRPVPLIAVSLSIGLLYVLAIVLAASLSLGVTAGQVVIYASGVIGVGAFLLALPAFGYAVRTDANSAKTLEQVEKEAKRELTQIHPDAGLPPGSESEASALPRGTVPDPAIQPLGVISVDNTHYALIARGDVPARVFSDLLSEGVKKGDLTAGELVAKLDYVAREPGKGNKPWLFGFHGLDEVWRITYGGKRKKGPTLRRLSVPQNDAQS